MDSFNGHPFMVHWGATAGGFSAVIRTYTKERVSVIMLANLEDGAFGVDAISKASRACTFPAWTGGSFNPPATPTPRSR